MDKITIIIEDISLSAELFNTTTAQLISTSLPIEGMAHVWGEEIYFEIPLNIELEPEARADVEIGELAYWPSGPAFCIFFGPTPVSIGEKPKAFSAVNVFGKMIDDIKPLKTVTNGAKILIKKE